MSYVLRTPRLVLRPVLEDEPAEALARLSARVHEGAGPSPEQARGIVERSAAAFRAHRYGTWLLVPAGEVDPVGWCGLKPGDDPASPELMFGLLPEARGAGLVTEATLAVVEYAVSLPGTRKVWGAARPDNAASARVMERAGLAFEGRRVLDGAEYVTYGRAAGR